MTRKNLFARARADARASSRPSTLPEVKPRSTEAGSALQPRVKAIGNLGALLSDMSHEAEELPIFSVI